MPDEPQAQQQRDKPDTPNEGVEAPSNELVTNDLNPSGSETTTRGPGETGTKKS